MPDPLTSSPTPVSGASDYDAYLDEVGKVSRADAPNSSHAEPTTAGSPAVPVLVSSVSRPPYALPPASSPLPGSAANNNAQRTSERSGVSPYAAAGVTAAGDSVHVSAAALKGRDPKTGFDAEVLSLSAQLGAQNELQAGLVRVGVTGGIVTASPETITARANAGIHNDDGSTGLNLGVNATAVGSEVTIGHASSLTYGVAASLGGGASIGLRDADHDGKRELCVRASVEQVTFGFCLESPL